MSFSHAKFRKVGTVLLAFAKIHLTFFFKACHVHGCGHFSNIVIIACLLSPNCHAPCQTRQPKHWRLYPLFKDKPCHDRWPPQWPMRLVLTWWASGCHPSQTSWTPLTQRPWTSTSTSPTRYPLEADCNSLAKVSPTQQLFATLQYGRSI